MAEKENDKEINGIRDRVRSMFSKQVSFPPQVSAEEMKRERMAEKTREAPQRNEGLTQEQMDAMRNRFWSEKSRLEYQGFKDQKFADLKRTMKRNFYEVKKKEAMDSNRVDAFLGDAKGISPDQVDKRPGEKLVFGKTKRRRRYADPASRGPSL